MMNEAKMTELTQVEDMAYFRADLSLLAGELQPGREEGNLQRHDERKGEEPRRKDHLLLYRLPRGCLPRGGGAAVRHQGPGIHKLSQEVLLRGRRAAQRSGGLPPTWKSVTSCSMTGASTCSSCACKSNARTVTMKWPWRLSQGPAGGLDSNSGTRLGTIGADSRALLLIAHVAADAERGPGTAPKDAHEGQRPTLRHPGGLIHRHGAGTSRHFPLTLCVVEARVSASWDNPEPLP